MVGIELEGGWAKVPPKCKIERDSSVFKNPSTKLLETLAKLGVNSTGELVSKPMPPIGMTAWIKKHYPTYSDQTCGLHIHMSFNDNWHYQQLMVPEYQVTVLYYLKLWAVENKLPDSHPIWDRITGKNEYCNQSFWPDEQLKTGVRKDYDHFRKGNRYSAIAYRRKNYIYTIECRVLPMMETPELAVSALRQVIRITNAFLVKTRNRKIKVRDMTLDPENGIVERDVEDM